MADNPPAYSIHPGVPSLTSNGSHPPPPTVDQVHIFSRHEDIKGTFYVDPNVPLLDQSRRRKCKRKSQQQLPHASFRTRKGDISIDLGTTGDAHDTKKANIDVATYKGDIKINLLRTLPIRPLGLDVTSRKGDIVLFLPEKFSGVVHLTTRKGEMIVLPALTSIMNVVKTSDKEIIFMIGPQNPVDDSRETTLCQLNARKGTIVVGLSGRDQYTSQPGFWKRIGCYFRGEKPQ
ncbi:hypothetical protein BYT27DRAFT_7227127 [Phlegmacium glaucopus]|nr:hypothetical protein BYT27DRAFT_7227127 [Phlegmacium glaucopus]